MTSTIMIEAAKVVPGDRITIGWLTYEVDRVDRTGGQISLKFVGRAHYTDYAPDHLVRLVAPSVHPEQLSLW